MLLVAGITVSIGGYRLTVVVVVVVVVQAVGVKKKGLASSL